MSKILEIALAVLTLLPKCIEAVKAIEEQFATVNVGSYKKELLVSSISEAAEQLGEMDTSTITTVATILADKIIWFGKKIGFFKGADQVADTAGAEDEGEVEILE